MDIPQNYTEVNEYLLSQYEEVDGYRFYSELFPDNENTGELNDDYSKPNAIYLYTDERDKDSKRRMRRRIMLKDTWEEDYMNYVEQNEKTLCGGLTYRARSNKLEHAHKCNAIIIDLDGVGLKEIRNLFLRFGKSAEKLRTLPMPTYIATSGKGIHVYYVLDEPIDLFPNIKVQLKSLKHDLTFRMWDYKATSQLKNIQYQSINQGFRMVGSVNDKYGTQIRAYRTGDKVSLEYLNGYVKSKVDVKQRFRPSSMSKAEAMIKFPEWYARTFDENGNKRKDRKAGKWDIAGKVNGSDPYALYHWWIRQEDRAKGGHRYFFLMCMSIYASKCDVPKSKLRKDMYEVYEKLKEIEHDNPLTKDDIESALETYSKEYWNFTIDNISKLSDIHIEKNKRNGRRQSVHLKRARALQEVDYPDGEWRNKEGAPEKRKIVIDYLLKHPEAKKADVIRDTGLSKPTVYKYYDEFQKGTPEVEECMEKLIKEKNDAIAEKYFNEIMQQLDEMKNHNAMCYEPD